MRRRNRALMCALGKLRGYRENRRRSLLRPRASRGHAENRLRGLARMFFTLSLGLGLSLMPCHLDAQSAVRSVAMFADLNTDDGSVDVRVEIDFVSDDTAGLRVELLGFANGTADGFRTTPDGPLIRFEERSGSREWVVLESHDFERMGLERIDGYASPSGPRPGPDSARTYWRLAASYVVKNARNTRGETVRVHIPVLTVALPSLRDVGDVFHAEVLVPTHWSVMDGFPTALRRTADGVYAVDLAVAPSVISVRARTDGAWRPGFPLILDVLAGFILLGFVVTGWRHLRSMASTPAADGGIVKTALRETVTGRT